jgi:hypothetical protein
MDELADLWARGTVRAQPPAALLALVRGVPGALDRAIWGDALGHDDACVC